MKISSETGVAPIIFVIVLAILGATSFIGIKTLNNLQTQSQTPQQVLNSSQATTVAPSTPSIFSRILNRSPQVTVIPTKVPSIPTPTVVTVKTPTLTPTKVPTPTPTQSGQTTSTASTPTNPYNLTSPTGSVKVMVKPSSGSLAYTPQAELSTVSGFKVLDGRSTDKITQFGPNRTDDLRGEIIFSTAPPGPYKVRISYNGSWSDQKDLTVTSTQQSYVEFSVQGVIFTPTPTPTPIPKPVCGIFISPSSSGTAPYQANVCVGNNSNPYQSIQTEWVDYDGNGTWDYQGPSYGCHSYTFQTSGTYYPKAKITNTLGVDSDTCQTTATIN